MFRIAAGEELGYDDPEIRGHSIEYRINAEDGGRNFMPAPGTLTRWHAPGRSRRPPRRRLRPGRDHPRLLRLPHRQAHRHRPRPHPGARALAPRPGRVRRRRHAHRHPVPPRRGPRPRLRRRLHAHRRGRVHRLHPWIETEFDNQIEPYAGDSGRGRRAGRAAEGHRRGRRQAPRGRAARRARRAVGRWWRSDERREEGQARRQEGRRRRLRRRRHLPHAGHDRQGRRRPTARRSPRATPSSSWRR